MDDLYTPKRLKSKEEFGRKENSLGVLTDKFINILKDAPNYSENINELSNVNIYVDSWSPETKDL